MALRNQPTHHPYKRALLMNIEKKGNPDRKVRVFTLDTWDRLRKIGMSGAKLKPVDLVYIGLRDFEPEEEAIIKENNIKVITVKDVRTKGAAAAVKETMDHLSKCDKIHVSFDVDSLDPSISVGTGTPVKNGLFLEEARGLLQGFCADPKTATLDVVEINPILDEGNRTAELAVELIASALGKRIL